MNPQIPTGGGDSRSFFTLRRKNRSKIGKLELENGLVVNNISLRVESDVGQQNCAIIGTYYTDTDINQHFALSNNAASAKIFLGSVHGESLITNNENVNARITIYDVLARRDSGIFSGGTNPLTIFQQGFADNSGGAAANYLVPGTTPYDNPRFTQWFKILKNTSVILSPGAVHSHVVHYAPSKMFSHEITSYSNTSSIGDLTLYTFILFHGSPVNEIATQATVSLSHIALDIVQKEAYHWKYVATNSGVASVTQTIPVALVLPTTMQDDGQEIPENEA